MNTLDYIFDEQFEMRSGVLIVTCYLMARIFRMARSMMRNRPKQTESAGAAASDACCPRADVRSVYRFRGERASVREREQRMDSVLFCSQLSSVLSFVHTLRQFVRLVSVSR